MKQANSANTIWLDWRRPALPGVVAAICDRFIRGRQFDLSGLTIVTPGMRSRQRLLELLVDAAERQELIFTPPELLPLSALPERLLPGGGSYANSVQELIAWVLAIQQTDRSWLPRSVIDSASADRLATWLPWAQLLQRLHSELASDGWLFADLRRALVERRLPVDRSELARWDSLIQVQQAYFAQLQQLGCADRQQACIAAVAQQACRLERDLYLVGMVDLNQGLRSMLAQVASRVTPVVFADPDQHDHFDALGCLVIERWLESPLELPDASLRFVDRPSDQAHAVVEILAGLGEKVPADQITIGVPDLRVVPHLVRRLDADGVATRRLAGKPLVETSLWQLLAATSRYVESGGYAEFAAWVRHPDVFDYLCRATGESTFLGELDDFQNQMIPTAMDVRQVNAFRGSSRLAAVTTAARELLAPLWGSPRGLASWAEICRHFLATIYGTAQLDASDPASERWSAAAATINAQLENLRTLPGEGLPPASAGDAIQMLLDLVRDESISPPPRPGAIDLAGWLDLPLDDAAVTIVASFNDETIPSSVAADPFLNNSLRQSLGLMDNSRRYARDAYALAVLASSGRQLWLISARFDTDHNPLLPSRLLFACDDATMIRRAQAFFDFAGPIPQGLWLGRGGSLPRRQQWPIPQPRTEWARVSQLRVTDFKQYLQCPYRFFLGRVLRLQSLSDDWHEMPPYVFGQLAHDVLEAFARGSAADAEDPAEIRAFLADALQQQSVRKFGSAPAAAVRIQIAQIQQRLDAFADRQAAWRSRGWRILDAEVPDLEHWLEVDGEPFRIYGRIDRIDRNEQDGSFAIFDYKTSDSTKTPEQTHRDKSEWIDLQLPLYRHLARHKYPELQFPCQLGYVLLPRTLAKVEFSVAPWTEEELQGADDTARQVIQRIRRAEFWPPTDPPPYPDTEWTRICQEHVAERWRPTCET